MDLPTILNSRGPAVVPTVEQQLQHHINQLPQIHGQPYLDSSSDRGNSPHTSDHSSRYSNRPGEPLQRLANMASNTQFATPPQIPQTMPMLPGNYMNHNGLPGGDPTYVDITHSESAVKPPGNQGSSQSAKAFACSNCGKAFARRSDLARHGQFMPHSPCYRSHAKMCTQNVSILAFDHMFANIQDATSNLFKGRL